MGGRRSVRGAAAALVLLSGAGAAAQEALPWAQADYEAEWRIASLGHVVTVRYSAQAKKLRFELNDPKGTVVVKDLAGGGVLVSEGDGKAGVKAGRGQPLGLPAQNPTGARRQIAGESCAVHGIGPAELCLSADGVLLAVSAGEERIEALRVIRKPQDPALFAPPEGAPVTPLPGGAEGGTPLLPF